MSLVSYATDIKTICTTSPTVWSLETSGGNCFQGKPSTRKSCLGTSTGTSLNLLVSTWRACCSAFMRPTDIGLIIIVDIRTMSTRHAEGCCSTRLGPSVGPDTAMSSSSSQPAVLTWLAQADPRCQNKGGTDSKGRGLLSVCSLTEGSRALLVSAGLLTGA